MENTKIVIVIRGISNNEFLRGLGFTIKKGGWLFLNGKPVTDSSGKRVRAGEVQAIVPDKNGMRILSDPLEVIDYFNPLGDENENGL